MIPEAGIATVLLKAAGSVLGAVLAFVFQPPKTSSEFWTRIAFSVISGMLFGDPVRLRFAWDETVQMVLAAGALTALLSWFVMGAVVRFIANWKGK